MHNSGVGIYILTIVWIICILLCWVSVRSGFYYIGKISLGISVVTTVAWLQLPKSGLDAIIANLANTFFVFRLVTLFSLTVSLILSINFLFVYVVLPPVETKRVQYIGKDY